MNTVLVPAFSVMAGAGDDHPTPRGTQLPNFRPDSWQGQSLVRSSGARYLEQYLRRRGLSPAGQLRVSISGVSCKVLESRAYGRASYRVIYSMRMEATLGGEPLWRGTVHHQELNLTGLSLITERIRLTLVKRGVNELVGVLCGEAAGR